MASEYDEFVEYYQDLEYDRKSKQKWSLVGLGGIAVGAVVGLATRNIEAGSSVALLVALGVTKPILKIQDSIDFGRSHLKALAVLHERELTVSSNVLAVPIEVNLGQPEIPIG